jgi:hypothetical protein
MCTDWTDANVISLVCVIDCCGSPGFSRAS